MTKCTSQAIKQIDRECQDDCNAFAPARSDSERKFASVIDVKIVKIIKDIQQYPSQVDYEECTKSSVMNKTGARARILLSRMGRELEYMSIMNRPRVKLNVNEPTIA